MNAVRFQASGGGSVSRIPEADMPAFRRGVLGRSGGPANRGLIRFAAARGGIRLTAVLADDREER